MDRTPQPRGGGSARRLAEEDIGLPEAATAANKNRELDLKEMEIQLDMFKEGANLSSAKEEKEMDRNAKKAIAALDALIDLAKTEASIDKDKALKAADMLTNFIGQTRRG